MKALEIHSSTNLGWEIGDLDGSFIEVIRLWFFLIVAQAW